MPKTSVTRVMLVSSRNEFMTGFAVMVFDELSETDFHDVMKNSVLMDESVNPFLDNSVCVQPETYGEPLESCRL